MLQMESIATIGMTTFQACWSSFESQPLICYHPLNKLFNVFCTSSNSHKTNIHYKNSWLFNMSSLATITFFINIFVNLAKGHKG